MNPLIVRGGRIVDPATGLDEEGDLRIEDGRIAAVGAVPQVGDEEILDASGHVVAPGFVDLCVHLREPGFEEMESIRSGAQAALAGGFTSVAAMPDTDPPIDNAASVTYVRLKGGEAMAARVLPVGALTIGREGLHLAEMGGMAEVGVCAFSDEDRCVQRSDVFLRALRYARMLGKPVLTRCEDLHLRGQGMANNGLRADLLGLPAIAPGTEEIMVSRNLGLAELDSAPLHLLHLSSAGSLRLVREGKASRVPVTCSVTPPHLLLTEEEIRDYDPVYKFAPPLRSEADRTALVEGIRDGAIDAISSGHTPRGEGEKKMEFAFAAFGTGALETAFPVLHSALVGEGLLELPRLIELLSTGPARILGIPAGTLEVGAAADVVVLDLATPWRIEPRAFLSRCKMTPFAGQRVTGRIRHVLIDGEVRLRDSELVPPRPPTSREREHAS